jgi:hypothetical protein
VSIKPAAAQSAALPGWLLAWRERARAQGEAKSLREQFAIAGNSACSRLQLIAPVVTEQEWVEFLATGVPQSVSVTRIPAELSRALACSSQLVQMHHAYAVKAHLKHGIDPYRLPMVGITIDLGRAVLDSRGRLQFFYFEDVIFGKWFHVVVKTNVACSELWVSSFHMTKPSEVARHTKSGKVLRAYK